MEHRDTLDSFDQCYNFGSFSDHSKHSEQQYRALLWKILSAGKRTLFTTLASLNRRTSSGFTIKHAYPHTCTAYVALFGRIKRQEKRLAIISIGSGYLHKRSSS